MDFKKEIVFLPAWDKRSDDPAKNYGIHGAEMHFRLTGEKGMIQFVTYTSWQLPHVQKEIDLKIPGLKKVQPMTWIEERAHPMYHLFHKPEPADLGYHSPVPMYEGQTSRKDCPFLPGGTCYYDGSGLAAEGVFRILVEQGSEGVWKHLEEVYNNRFNDHGTEQTT